MFKRNSSQLYDNTQRKYRQAGPHFGCEIHKHTTQQHQKYGQNTPPKSRLQHAAYSFA